VPARPADCPFARQTADFGARQLFVQFESLAQKLDHFLIGIMLHGLFAGLVQVFHRLEEALVCCAALPSFRQPGTSDEPGARSRLRDFFR